MLLAASGMRALWFDRWMDPVVKSVLLLGNWTIDSAWSSLHCLGRCRALIGCEGMFGRHVRQTRSPDTFAGNSGNGHFDSKAGAERLVNQEASASTEGGI